MKSSQSGESKGYPKMILVSASIFLTWDFYSKFIFSDSKYVRVS